MTDVREVAEDDWAIMRAVRLDALRDMPCAFGSTHARETAFTEADWRRRARGRNGFLAYLPDFGAVPVGIAGGIRESADTAQLVSMWVRPRARGRRVGRTLVAAVIGWARAQDLTRVCLWVTDSNEQALRLYGRCGFTPTGARQPLPSDPSRTEIGMTLPL